jgi:hypothetical protein
VPGTSLVRFVLLAALIVAVALALWLLDVDRVWIVLGVIVAWLAASAIELVSWKRAEARWHGGAGGWDRPAYPARPPAPSVRPAPSVAPPAEAPPAVVQEAAPAPATAVPAVETRTPVTPGPRRRLPRIRIRVRRDGEPEPPAPEAVPAPEPLDETAAEPKAAEETAALEFQPEPEPAPGPEPEPEPPPPPVEPVRPTIVPAPPPQPPEPPAAPPPPAGASVVRLPSRGPRTWNVWELERIARTTAENDPRGEEQLLLVRHLREFADANGTLPVEFDPLVREAFGGLLADARPT